MESTILARVDARVLPLYQYFGFRDWLEEPSIEETRALLTSARVGVVASDGRQAIVYCGQSEKTVRVACQFWDGQPSVVGGIWQGMFAFRMSCPSGELYIDQPTMLAIDLARQHKMKPGILNARVLWRARRDMNSASAVRSTQDETELYTLQLWQ